MSLNAFLQGLETNARERTSLIAAIKREIGAPSQSVAKRPRGVAAPSSADTSSDGNTPVPFNPDDSTQISPALNPVGARSADDDNVPDEPKPDDARRDVASQKVNMDKLKEDLISRKKEVMKRLHQAPNICTADLEAYESYRARAWQEYYDNMDAWKGYFDEASRHNERLTKEDG
eukprot:GEMP01083116.1.p1 GENE.GEMP01083116.1~~GEMP01083116.1.p1  ORF type:complete len:192 (+),score=52.53 GEMP01083116.1:52-576(+)